MFSAIQSKPSLLFLFVKSKMKVLEICAVGLHAALLAQQAGADRIELCANLESGGLTPSFGTLKAVKDQIEIPVHVLIRPRRGDYIYDQETLSIMLSDIQLVKSLGYKGIVVGLLNKNAELDVLGMRTILDAAEGMSVSFHRAIDVAKQPMKIIEHLIGLGVSRVLTSGGMHTALQGIHQIKTMQKTFGDDIVIMPGSGINTANVKTILQETGVSEIHMSAKSNHYSEMIVSDSNGRLHSPLLQMNDWWWHDVESAEINEVARMIKNSS